MEITDEDIPRNVRVFPQVTLDATPTLTRHHRRRRH